MASQPTPANATPPRKKAFSMAYILKRVRWEAGFTSHYISLQIFLKSWILLQLSSNQNPGCLVYAGDYTTQQYGDYCKPLEESLLTN